MQFIADCVAMCHTSHVHTITGLSLGDFLNDSARCIDITGSGVALFLDMPEYSSRSYTRFHFHCYYLSQWSYMKASNLNTVGKSVKFRLEVQNPQISNTGIMIQS